MFSLQNLFGKDDKCFQLLEASAEECRISIHSLVSLLEAPREKRSLGAFIEARRKDKRITKDLTERLLKAFVTPLEREDIEALAEALYKIPKTVEKFSERLLIADRHMHGVDFSKQIEMLGKAGETVGLLVKDLRKGINVERVRVQNDQLQNIEGEADKLMLESLRKLYSGEHGTLNVIMLKDLYEVMEKIFDRCRDAGNIVLHIVLKNS